MVYCWKYLDSQRHQDLLKNGFRFSHFAIDDPVFTQLQEGEPFYLIICFMYKEGVVQKLCP